MVLGLKSRQKRGASVQIDYAVNVVEIKPWPPSPSLQSVQSVLLQWKNGEKSSGSFIAVAGDSGIVFNESFLLPVTLHPDKKSRDKFQKNHLEFVLYDPRRDKGTKEQLLGTATFNLSDYGVIEDVLTIAVPMSCKKGSKNGPQPALYVRIEPIDDGSSRSSPTVRSSRTSLDQQDGQDSLDGSEIASFTDDDISSHSSQTVASSAYSARASPSRSDKNGGEPVSETSKKDNQESSLKGSSLLPPPLSSSAESSTAVISHLDVNEESEIRKKNIQANLENRGSSREESSKENAPGNVKDEHIDRLTRILPERQVFEYKAPVERLEIGLMDIDTRKEDQSTTISSDYKSFDKVSIGGFRRTGTMGSAITTGKTLGIETPNSRLKHAKSQIYESAGRSGYSRSGNETEMATEADIIRTVGNRARSTKPMESRKETANRLPRGSGSSTAPFKSVQTNEASDDKPQTDPQIQMLEDELREVATLEIGLYSAVAEHGGSGNKVHAPARRLSRFYLHACKEDSQAKIANSARAAISGLVMVSKACGNDVPRLTFWLSNAIMLRAIVSQSALETRPLNHRYSSSAEADEWEDIGTFTFALEKTESWIFNRIVESIWWQTLTPHMQTTVANKTRGSSAKKTNNASRCGFANQDQGNFSIELWKKAFKDACERLCPIRAGGHECGCLPVIARLVMEQLVGRLDVAMFNAILRESSEEMPSNPVSDPISDSRVLPIRAGKLSFGAGAQLKNAIGNWSRWLSDLFWIEDSKDKKGPEAAKPFRLLNALSDLMMLPLETLTDVPTRKEFCPLLGPMLIKKVLLNYVPDEFCPKPIPRSVIDALDYEDPSATDDFTDFVSAPKTVYSPPPETSLASFMKEVGSHGVQKNTSFLRKLNTSDDELDELNSPLTSIINAKFGGGRGKVSRYRLLREVWKDYEQ